MLTGAAQRGAGKHSLKGEASLLKPFQGVGGDSVRVGSGVGVGSSGGTVSVGVGVSVGSSEVGGGVGVSVGVGVGVSVSVGVGVIVGVGVMVGVGVAVPVAVGVDVGVSVGPSTLTTARASKAVPKRLKAITRTVYTSGGNPRVSQTARRASRSSIVI